MAPATSDEGRAAGHAFPAGPRKSSSTGSPRERGAAVGFVSRAAAICNADSQNRESANVDLPEHAARALLEPRQLREIQGRVRGRETSSHDPSRLPAPDLVDPSARSDLA